MRRDGEYPSSPNRKLCPLSFLFHSESVPFLFILSASSQYILAKHILEWEFVAGKERGEDDIELVYCYFDKEIFYYGITSVLGEVSLIYKESISQLSIWRITCLFLLMPYQALVLLIPEVIPDSAGSIFYYNLQYSINSMFHKVSGLYFG